MSFKPTRHAPSSEHAALMFVDDIHYTICLKNGARCLHCSQLLTLETMKCVTELVITYLIEFQLYWIGKPRFNVSECSSYNNQPNIRRHLFIKILI